MGLLISNYRAPNLRLLLFRHITVPEDVANRDDPRESGGRGKKIYRDPTPKITGQLLALREVFPEFMCCMRRVAFGAQLTVDTWTS